MGIIWTIVIGLIAGIIAKFIMPGSNNEPSGFVLTAVLGARRQPARPCQRRRS
jgi:uncharacterized membrane protein YeaQ/YmgE (transglycosylase-associated protein family)